MNKEMVALLDQLNTHYPDIMQQLGPHLEYDNSFSGIAMYTPQIVKVGPGILRYSMGHQLFVLIHETLHLMYHHERFLNAMIACEEDDWRHKPESPERVKACEMGLDLMTNQMTRGYMQRMGQVVEAIHFPGEGLYKIVKAVPDVEAFIFQFETARKYSIAVDHSDELIADVGRRLCAERIEADSGICNLDAIDEIV